MHGQNRESPPATIKAEKFNSFFSTIGLETVSHLQSMVFNDGSDHADGIDGNIFWRGSKCTSLFKRTLSPYFRNLPLLHITIRLHLTSRLLKFMQWLAGKQ